MESGPTTTKAMQPEITSTADLEFTTRATYDSSQHPTLAHTGNHPTQPAESQVRKLHSSPEVEAENPGPVRSLTRQASNNRAKLVPEQQASPSHAPCDFFPRRRLKDLKFSEVPRTRERTGEVSTSSSQNSIHIGEVLLTVVPVSKRMRWTLCTRYRSAYIARTVHIP